MIQAGLRMENTNIDGEQKVNNTSFDKIANLFPVYWQPYTFSDRNEWNLPVESENRPPSYSPTESIKFFLDPHDLKESNLILIIRPVGIMN
ncbi:MAG: outer membrane beta-barrel protein [Saprospiraceae bacterium]|nr:outer membrane beta-barrel protein [Candidatus Brachybacter algidus]